jgi:predicted SAM-dependent methyltransferase
MKLNIGSGLDYREGFVNIDWNWELKADIYLDIDTEDLPQKNDSVEYILASHVIEHLRDFNHFMNECRRVLKPRCVLEIITPSPLCEWFWQDPSHVRGYMPNTFIIYCVVKECKIRGLDLWSEATTSVTRNMVNNVEAVTITAVLKK